MATANTAPDVNAVKCLRLQDEPQRAACKLLAKSCETEWCTDEKCKFQCALGKLFAAREETPVAPVTAVRPAFRIDLPAAYVPLLPRGDADSISIGKQKALEALDKELNYQALRDSGLAR
jgi:hypothetical protein